MRTTVRLDDELLAEAKTRAARSGRTVSAVLEDAVRVAFGLSQRRNERPATFTTYHGEGGVRPGVDIDSNAALLDLMEEGLPLDKLR